MFFDKLKKSKGGYIFLSHSHDDIEKVRGIRNALEKDGFEPLCFYLKCLDDDSEIEDLIKREIDAREWFMFINSENSRKSKWVALEREYITKTNSKKIITVDIDDEQTIADAVHKISHNLRIFVSYSSKDRILARKIKNKLEDKDYLVFFEPDSIPVGFSATEVIQNAIAEASKEGCVLVLLTENYVKSPWIIKEIENAIMNHGTIVPIMVGSIDLPPEFEICLSNIQFLRFSENPDDEEIDGIIDVLGHLILKK